MLSTQRQGYSVKINIVYILPNICGLSGDPRRQFRQWWRLLHKQSATVSSQASYRTDSRRAPHEHTLIVMTTSPQIGPDSSFLRFSYIKLYRTAYNFAWFLCRCENWALTMREEHRLKVSENKVLGKISGPKTGESDSRWGN